MKSFSPFFISVWVTGIFFRRIKQRKVYDGGETLAPLVREGKLVFNKPLL